jgi:HK97 gp10 family phage protein
MGLEITGMTELTQDISEMADALRSSGGNGSRACNWILQNAAQPILEQMLMNASSNPKVITGKLRGSIKIGRAVRHRRGGYSVTVGIHRSDGGAAYGNPVEFGHGGPRPAPPHPFVRPAFDVRVDEAYEKVKQQLIAALQARGLRSSWRD